MNAQHLTVRNVPSEVAAALKAEQHRRGLSLNQTVIEVLGQALAVKPRRRSNGIKHLAGTWTERQFREFEKATRVTREIDSELWR